MAILGTDVVLQLYKEGSYEEFICATECSIEINTEVKDVRGPVDGKWKMVRGKRNSYSVSLNGLIVLGEARPTTFWLVDNQIQWLDLPFRMVFTDPETMLIKIMAGNALIERSQLTSSSTSFANSSFDFTGNGALTITDSSTVCSATIGEIEIGGGNEDNGAVASFTYSGVTNASRLEYSIDGGPRETIFDPGTDGVVFLFGLLEGAHTLQVWVVCESGIDGETSEQAFEISGGEPIACAAPGTPTVEELTNSTARLEWVAASPTPGDGYEWRYGGVVLGTVIGSGQTNDLFTELSGLIEGGEYYFEVRSLCEEGVSESIWRRVEFIPETPVCNSPGSPLMSAVTSSSATASWTAASPAPAGGYQWVLRETVSNAIVDFGVIPGISVNLIGLTNGLQYTFSVQSVCIEGSSYSPYQSVQFIATDDIVCNVPGTPVMSLITDTTATATWTAPSPAPGDGYEWEVLNGMSVIDSGTTAGLSVNLTGLPANTSLTFRVKSICETGVSESGFNTVAFDTEPAESLVEWDFLETGGNGTFSIEVNSGEIVNEPAANSGSFTAQSGDNIEAFLTSASGDIVVDDVTASTNVTTVSGPGTISATFSPTLGHQYQITATVNA